MSKEFKQCCVLTKLGGMMNTNLNNRNINKTYTGNSEKISVIIVDDNEKVIENIDSALSKDTAIQIIGKAKNGQEAYELIRKSTPDVVILDLIMPKMDGLSLMNKVNEDGAMIKMPFFII